MFYDCMLKKTKSDSLPNFNIRKVKKILEGLQSSILWKCKTNISLLNTDTNEEHQILEISWNSREN